MNQFLKVGYCFILFFLTVSMIHDRRIGFNSYDWKNDSPKIQTKKIEIDLSEARQLQSLNNALQTQQGIRVADQTKDAVLYSNVVSVPVDTLEPFLAFGSRWVGPSAGKNVPGDIRFEIRYSSDTHRWSKWEAINVDEHLTIAADTAVGELQFLPKTTRYIQCRFILKSSARTGVRLRSVLFSFTSPGSTPQRTLDALKARSEDRKLGDKLKQNQNQPYPRPDYVTRTEWDCPDGQEPSGSVTLTNVTHQIVHHSAGTNSSSDWPAVVRAIWDYHVNTNNWSDIGYNWLVDPNGIIYQGRGWIDGNDEVQGAHFCGTNSNTMGACLLGNFEEVQPASEALASLEDLLAWKSDQKGIDPLGREYHASSGLDLYNISGHRDGCSTLCPGGNLYAKLPAIRNNVDALLGETPITGNEIETVTNYPNPFAESTTISFSLMEAANVQITIWDLTGRQISQVTDKFYEAGENTVKWNTGGRASGIYFCRIKLNGQTATQKLVLLR